jgi:hypothetical protein
MPRERTALTKLADRQLDAGARESSRFVDLQLDFFDEATGECIGSFGGKWDRVEKRYDDGEPAQFRAVRLHAGQLDAARWFEEWLGCYLANDFAEAARIYDAVFYGGRRGGKSNLAWACIVAFALAVPGVICFIVVPSESYFGEPANEIERLMPREWYTSIGEPPTYLFPNGSQIAIKSGHIPRLLKQGRVDFVLINEGQALIKQSYDTISASIVDTGGLIITACNPPDVGDPGDWVAEIVSACDRGDRQHAKAWFFDPEVNPHIDQQALRALAEKYDRHTYDVQIRGKLLLTPDTVLHEWDRRENERPMPALGDCTTRFLKHFEGFELRDIVSIDVQSYPWIAAVRWRAFRNPMAPEDMEQAFLWGIGESFIDKGDEIDTATELIDMGCDPSSTLVVMDASCDWQQAERDEGKQRTTFRGKGSMDMIRGCGFRHVVPPDQNMKANPDIADRCRAANSRICTATGNRFVFIDPKKCQRSIESIRKWKTRPNGMPSRSAKAAHAGDAISYAIWRFFPRRGETNKVETIKIKSRFAGKTRLEGF